LHRGDAKKGVGGTAKPSPRTRSKTADPGSIEPFCIDRAQMKSSGRIFPIKCPDEDCGVMDPGCALRFSGMTPSQTRTRTELFGTGSSGQARGCLRGEYRQVSTPIRSLDGSRQCHEKEKSAPGVRKKHRELFKGKLRCNFLPRQTA